MSFFTSFGGLLPICFNETVREKDEELRKADDERRDLEKQLKDKKREVKDLRRERDQLLNKAETSSGYASTVVTEDMVNDLKTDVNAFKTRILELEARAKSDKHQIISLQVRLDQVIAAKSAAEKALLVSEAQNSQLKARIGELEARERGSSDAAATGSSSSSSSSSEGSSSSGGGGGNLNQRVPTPVPRAIGHSPTSVLDASSQADLESIRVVNRFLKKLADDAAFQEKLKKPTVQWAFVYWSGGDTSAIEHRADEIKKCDVVRSIYPVLDTFEQVCIQSNVKIPLDHVARGLSELDDDALVTTFGTAFCHQHRLLRSSP
jgi:hypothetical protein